MSHSQFYPIIFQFANTDAASAGHNKYIIVVGAGWEIWSKVFHSLNDFPIIRRTKVIKKIVVTQCCVNL